MSRFFYRMALLLGLLLAACSPATPAASTGVIRSVTLVRTVLPGGVIASPPAGTPPLPASTPAATPIPTLAGGLSPTELKYRVLDQFPDLFFCDPDYYPVARADETGLALQRFADLQANAEEFDAILAHNHLSGQSTFSDAQKLLVYQQHKKLAAIPLSPSGAGYAFQIRISQTKGGGEQIQGTIDPQGTIAIQERKPAVVTCPICLASGTRIDTPDGPASVQDLRVGSLVWTVDPSGTRVAAPVLRTSRTTAPANHQVVHLVMADGRELWVSPGHPTGDGRVIGQLQPGDRLDGALVQSAGLVAYGGLATYDLLPAGETGQYWANGILIGSTLK